ncbi:hypothetical protein MPER_14710, partial [Moniliophthora perniciosa FA553]
MRLFARATRALTMYDSAKCLTELEELPSIHQQTPWVLAMVGRAHYEKADYVAAERAFKAVRTLEPYRMWDMEKERPQALTCFRRAFQMDPACAYAYTL